MKSNIYSIITCFVSVISIILGGIIYMGCRPLSLYMFQWLGLNNIPIWFMNFRSSMEDQLPDWIVYELPGGLWAFSYVLMVGAIWSFNLKKCWHISILIPFAGLLSELCQMADWLPGHFDWMDCISYAAATCVGYMWIYFGNCLYSR